MLQGAKRNLTFLKVPNSACPSLYSLGCRQGRPLGSQEGKMIGIPLIRQHKKDTRNLRTELWRNSDKIRRLGLGGNFEVTLGLGVVQRKI